MTVRRPLAVGVGVAVSLLGAGILGGVAIERVRFTAERAEMLDRYEREVQQWRERIRDVSGGAPATRLPAPGGTPPRAR